MRPSAVRGLALALLAALAGCSDPTGRANHADVAALSAARARWAEARLTSYDYEYEQHCFCPNPGVITVSVRDGAVASVSVYSPPSSPYPDPGPLHPELYPTVEQLFQTVRDAIERRDDYFAAEYDPALGYPTRINTGDSGALDSGMEIIARNLRAVR